MAKSTKGRNAGVTGRTTPKGGAAPKGTPAGAKKPATGATTRPTGAADSADDDGPLTTKAPSSTKPRPRPAPTKRTTPPATGRYTPPIPKSEKVSPIWVPIVMFACLGLGMAMIILNYVNVLPGDDPSNVYLMVGLGLITVGFVTATRYH